MQELAIVVFDFRFEPAKAGEACEETILCRALDNRIRMLARAHGRYQALQERLMQMPQTEEYEQTPGQGLEDAEVRRLVAGLTPLQREICRALMDGQSVYAIARRSGRHYSTVRRNVERIREAFADAGLDPCQG